MAEKKITKADVVSALYEKTGMNRKEIRVMLDLFVHEIKSALMQRCVIELRGFGTFEVKVRKPRSGARNPRTGEAISLRPRGTVSFRPGRELKRDAWNITGDEAGASDAPSEVSDGSLPLV